jgi:short-subunit dehydrogenase
MDELRGLRALITGASSGIGAAIARELATRGVDLVLSARREQALHEVAASCQGVKVDVVAIDLAAPGAAQRLWTLATALRPVDIVINNAGFGYLCELATSDWARDAQMMQLNMNALVELCWRLLDTKRPRGYILNIASIGAYQAVPNMAIYAASKAFVRDFTEALHDELAGGPVSATCVCPGGVKTEFHAVAGAGNYGWVARMSMQSAEHVARFSVRAMVRRRRIAISGLVTKLSCWSVRLVPRRFASWIAGRIMGKKPAALPPKTGAAA